MQIFEFLVFSIRTGVLQGFILGPILLILTINYFFVELFIILLDHTSAMLANCNIFLVETKINKTMKYLGPWFCGNSLFLKKPCMYVLGTRLWC